MTLAKIHTNFYGIYQKIPLAAGPFYPGIFKKCTLIFQLVAG